MEKESKMIVLEYEVYDLLSTETILALLTGLTPVCIKVYAEKGTEGLLEDFLIEKKFAFFMPKEVEVADDFNLFTITITRNIKEIDLANSSGRIILIKSLPEPSVN